MLQYVEIIQLARRLSPQWLERADRVRPAIVEEVAKPQEIASLIGIWRLLQHRFKRTDRPQEIVLTEICEPNIQPDSRNVRSQCLGLVQHFERLRPPLAAHLTHAKIGESPRHTGVDRQHLPERALGIIQSARMQ